MSFHHFAPGALPLAPVCDRCGAPTDTAELVPDVLGFVCGACHSGAR